VSTFVEDEVPIGLESDAGRTFLHIGSSAVDRPDRLATAPLNTNPTSSSLPRWVWTGPKIVHLVVASEIGGEQPTGAALADQDGIGPDAGVVPAKATEAETKVASRPTRLAWRRLPGAGPEDWRFR